ncbi:efflux RND transporter periplasmic adaptor subunit [Bradyrhizobium sp. WD16]|uniref:efflux RND transporter periplasmic adaptor subunit n=1 Tax=Bradyrhizobium sp. WD16 TaxID=1521768 RepID=UPI0020A32D5F|nr:efflux RND transporter periplasmic adaptor subunit [Bradyrhizobium sp. WD16]UTD25590.1 efflux transporter periplasmic adaptor subunit [Bradyrhizobium sp. WD16]
MTSQLRSPGSLLAILAALGLAGCGQPQSDETSAQVGAPPARVTVLSVKPETVILVDELPGRVAAFRTAEIRPQVGGILEKRLFEQGAEVEAGQAMFQINSDAFKAEVGSAVAALQRVEAGLVRAQGRFDRAKQLVPTNAISREAYDDAAADVAQAKANVAEAQAALQRKNLDLAFATVRAPISGRTGQALVSEGALASVSSTTPLATIQQIDQVYVDVRQPASRIDAIREAGRSGQLDDASKLPVAIVAASGKAYPVTGRALFSDISVDPGTGSVTVRVEVQNPDRILLPGMYVRARMPRGVRHNALLVPQEAVVRDPAGTPQLVVVDDRKRAALRVVGLGEIVDRRYIVTSGLQAGETVVVQGQERAKNDAVVDAVPFSATAAQAAD